MATKRSVLVLVLAIFNQVVFVASQNGKEKEDITGHCCQHEMCPFDCVRCDGVASCYDLSDELGCDDVSDQVLLSYNRPPVFTPAIMGFVKALLRKDKADNAYRFPERNCLTPVTTTSSTTSTTTTTTATPSPVTTPSLWEILLKILQTELDTRTSTTTTIAPTTTTVVPTTEMPIWRLLLEKLQGILTTSATSITATGGTVAQVSPTQTLSSTTPSVGYDQSTAIINWATTGTSVFETNNEESATFDNITKIFSNGSQTPINDDSISVKPTNAVPDFPSNVSKPINNSNAYTVTSMNIVPDQTVDTETMSVTENYTLLNTNSLDNTIINNSSAGIITEILNTMIEISDLKTNISSEGEITNVTYISETVLHENASDNSTANVFSRWEVINGTHSTKLEKSGIYAEHGKLEINSIIFNLTESMDVSFLSTLGIENTTVHNSSVEQTLIIRNASTFDSENGNTTMYNEFTELNTTGVTDSNNSHSFILDAVMNSSDTSLNASETFDKFISNTSLSKNTFSNTTDHLFLYETTTSDLISSDRQTDKENSTSSNDLATNLTTGAHDTKNDTENGTSSNHLTTNLTTRVQGTKNDTENSTSSNTLAANLTTGAQDTKHDTENGTSSNHLATNITTGAQDTKNDTEHSTSSNTLAANLTTGAQETQNETQKQEDNLPMFSLMQQQVLADMIKAIEKELASRKGERADKSNKSSSGQVTTDNVLSITQIMKENIRRINWEMSTPSTLFEETTPSANNIYSTLETPVKTHSQLNEQDVTNVYVNSNSDATQLPTPAVRSATTAPFPSDKMFGLFPNTRQQPLNTPTTKAYDWSITTPINTKPAPPSSRQLPNMIVQLMERIGYTPLTPTAQSNELSSEQRDIESLLQFMNSDPQSRRRQAVHGLLASKESYQNGNRDVNFNSFKIQAGQTNITTNPTVFGIGYNEIVIQSTPISTAVSDRFATMRSIVSDSLRQPEDMTSSIRLTGEIGTESTIKNDSTQTLASIPSATLNESVWQQNSVESSTEIYLGFVASSVGKAKPRVQPISTSRPLVATKEITMATTEDLNSNGRAFATTPISLLRNKIDQPTGEQPSPTFRNNQASRPSLDPAEILAWWDNIFSKKRVPSTPAPIPDFRWQTPSTPSAAFFPTTQGMGNLQTCTKMNDVSGVCRDRIGNFKNPANCHTFVACSWTTMHVCACPRETLFDESIGVCNWETEVKCFVGIGKEILL